MCNRYAPPRPEDVSQRWAPRQIPVNVPPVPLFPRAQGPFVRTLRGEAERDGVRDRGQLPQGGTSADVDREVVIGQWALIPWFAKSAKLPYSTNNARFESVATAASFKHPWARGQRCIIPADWFDEPCWESGKNEWWRFRRSDGAPWGLAGLWSTWTDKSSGELVESYTMLTMNADAHPIMRRMHKPDPKLAADQQDKRSVVSIELEDVDTWLNGSIDDAARLVKLAPVDFFAAGPA